MQVIHSLSNLNSMSPKDRETAIFPAILLLIICPPAASILWCQRLNFIVLTFLSPLDLQVSGRV